VAGLSLHAVGSKWLAKALSREYGAFVGQLTSSCYHLLYLWLCTCSRALLLPCHLDLTCSARGNHHALARRPSSLGRVVSLSLHARPMVIILLLHVDLRALGVLCRCLGWFTGGLALCGGFSLRTVGSRWRKKVCPRDFENFVGESAGLSIDRSVYLSVCATGYW
jgi:hypothetical protein